MPEGHTVHRLARDHGNCFVGQRCSVSSPQGRFAEGAKQLHRRELKSVEAHGKHLCYAFSGGKLLHVHLGLYGKFRVQKCPPAEPRGQVRVRLVGRDKAFDLNGPNQCEVITEKQWSAIRERLGPDPLRRDSQPELAWEKISRSRAAIGRLLLDQSVIAGVGNIYRSEVLYLLEIHPETPGRAISEETFKSMWDLLKSLLEIGVKYNRIIIADPKEVGKPRNRMKRDERLLVYKHSHCGRCDAEIESWELGARKVFACPRCQLR